EGTTSWSSNHLENSSISELDADMMIHKEVLAVAVDLILPDDLLERILGYLPIASIFRVGSVCKRWNDVVSSKRFLWYRADVPPEKPWYFMFTSSDEPLGYAYNPIPKKWYSFDLPFIKTSNWFIASSAGLVCFMDNDSRSRLCVCNPITRSCRDLDEPPGPKSSDYSALGFSVDRSKNEYSVSVVKSKQVPGNFFQWELSIHLYDSGSGSWITSLTEVLSGWRGGDESVICGGALHFLIFSTGGTAAENRHALIRYDLTGGTVPHQVGVLMESFIPVPCSLTCGRLMNLNEMLIMVGGRGKSDRPDIIVGISIWSLRGREWEEIGRMPHKYFQGFGELDEVFASSGSDDLIYIHSYGAPALLVFDVYQKQWKWSQKCPVPKRFPLQLFTGFCFQPRLEISP
ncbi:hypothetical protein M569_07645, partial [Genlisea aurea]